MTTLTTTLALGAYLTALTYLTYRAPVVHHFKEPLTIELSSGPTLCAARKL